MINKNRYKQFFAGFVFVLLCVLSLSAEPQISEQTAWVMDTANVMSESEKATLEQYLTNLDSNTSNQSAVYTVNSLDGYAIEDYASRQRRFGHTGEQIKNEKGTL